LWPIRKLFCWLCYLFKSLSACFVNYQKAWLPALLRIETLGCLWCWAVERSVSNLDTSCSPQQRWEDISLSLQRKDHHTLKFVFLKFFGIF
jgi:hypothetical protein